ncbi:MAG: flippase [Deltaproteobacteria bacterium]|nr:flippase [Deltaproteobacteria bacterium]
MNRVWLRMLPSFIQAQLNGRHNLQKILGNTSWLFFDKMLRMGVGLFVGVWMARYLGPEQFGAFNFAIAFVALFGTFASLGLDGIVIRDIVREPARKYELLSSAFVLKLCGGCVAFLISLSAIFIMRPADSQAHWLVGIIAAGLIFQSFDAIDLWFQSQVQSKYTVLAKNGAFVILTVVRVFLILTKAPLVAFAYAALAEIIIGAAGLIMFYVGQKTMPSWCPRKEIARRLLSESCPAIISGLAIMIYMRIDQVMLAQMMGNREVGIYSAALRFSEIWYFIPMAIVGSVMPYLTHAKQESEEIYLRRNQQLFNNLARVAFAIAVPMTFLATFLVKSLYGQAYAGAGTILAIHIWAAVFVFIGVGMSPWFFNEGLLKYSLLQTVTGAIVNIGLNIFLIPRYGGAGAAIATVVSYGLAAWIFNWFFKKTRKLFMMQALAMLNAPNIFKGIVK